MQYLQNGNVTLAQRRTGNYKNGVEKNQGNGTKFPSV